jgi:formylmethanofuran dehydrogenase subunit D
MEKAVIDRIVDGHKAVLLVGEQEMEYILAAQLLPAGSKEGDWLKVEIEAGEIVKLKADQDETEMVRQRIEAKMALLRQKNNSSRFK